MATPKLHVIQRVLANNAGMTADGHQIAMPAGASRGLSVNGVTPTRGLPTHWHPTMTRELDSPPALAARTRSLKITIDSPYPIHEASDGTVYLAFWNTLGDRPALPARQAFYLQLLRTGISGTVSANAGTPQTVKNAAYTTDAQATRYQFERLYSPCPANATIAVQESFDLRVASPQFCDTLAERRDAWGFEGLYPTPPYFQAAQLMRENGNIFTASILSQTSTAIKFVLTYRQQEFQIWYEATGGTLTSVSQGNGEEEGFPVTLKEMEYFTAPTSRYGGNQQTEYPDEYSTKPDPVTGEPIPVVKAYAGWSVTSWNLSPVLRMVYGGGSSGIITGGLSSIAGWDASNAPTGQQLWRLWNEAGPGENTVFIGEDNPLLDLLRLYHLQFNMAA